MRSGTGNGDGNHRPICTICYEDVKPIAEDLQSISTCGHVFHELCLQQWLEYCPAGNKPTCPFCKQSCSRHHPTRLYFQSTSDPTQASAASNRAMDSLSADAEALAEEVRRLESKLLSLASTFESQQNHLKKLNDEVSVWKESAKREEAKKKEIKKEKDAAEQFLRMKMEELSRKSSECLKLEERSLGLAKELAALKLATDLNLGEEEMVKLASVGHRGNHENMVVVLKKSLALRNKSYKELIAQCNLLGRSETRTQQKLNKAQEKILKLKARTHELEKTLEEKENGFLRDLKASYQESANLSSPLHRKRPFSDLAEKPFESSAKSNEIHSNRSKHDFTSSGHKANDSVMDLEPDSSFFIDDVALELSPYSYKPPTNASACQNNPKFGSWSSDIGMDNVERNETHVSSSTWTTETLIMDDISKQMPSVDSPGLNLSSGKWARRNHMKAPTINGNLIAVGADGRGGRVKMLRAHDQLLDNKAQVLQPKKQKIKAKQSGQSRIENFFGKT